MPRPKGKRVYGVLIVLLVIGGGIAQFEWMQRARKTGSTDIVPPAFAERLQRWMLMRKGIDPGVAFSGGGRKAEKIVCETCMGSGSFLPDSGPPVMCPVCLGVGFRMIRRLDPADRICPLCAGMGRVELPDTGTVGTCPRCDGRGLVQSPAAAESAPDGI